MKIELSQRRREISDLFAKEDFQGLERLGIKMIGNPSSSDCAHYVVQQIIGHSLPTNNRTFDALVSLRGFETPHSGSNVIIYDDGFRNTHYGLYAGEKVTSKWGEGPVFEHAIEDVPMAYGNSVKFVSGTDALVLLSSADGY